MVSIETRVIERVLREEAQKYRGREKELTIKNIERDVLERAKSLPILKKLNEKQIKRRVKQSSPGREIIIKQILDYARKTTNKTKQPVVMGSGLELKLARMIGVDRETIWRRLSEIKEKNLGVFIKETPSAIKKIKKIQRRRG